MVRVGIGFDVHKLASGRDLVIGGVKIANEKGLFGHSDADVLLHAIIDALLGAAALGDIGSHFPDTDERWKNADSRRLLAHVGNLIREAGFAVNNVDGTVVLERPRLSSYVEEMRKQIALELGIQLSQVSVKATTSERIGFVGREEGAMAYAVCAIENRK